MNSYFQQLFYNNKNKITSTMVILFGVAKLAFVSYRMYSLGYWQPKQFYIIKLAPTICKATVYEYTVSNPEQLLIEKNHETLITITTHFRDGSGR